MSKKNSVTLIENFVSWQGEGPDSGQAMIILRFKYCTANCPWCDTRVKMRISAEAEYSLEDIQKTIYNTRSGLLITGGEPTHPRHIEETKLLLTDLDYPIANVESNGFQLYDLISDIGQYKNIHYFYSPKIFNEIEYDRAIELTDKLLKDFSESCYIKIVYEDNTLINNYLEYLSDTISRDVDLFDKVWLMPEGTNRSDLIKNSGVVFDACERYKFNFSSRDHLIFGFI